MSVRNLESLFAPRSLAIVGVSGHAGNLGAVVLRNLRQAGWREPLWLVGRKSGEIDGMRIHAGVAALPQTPELAVVCTPAATVPQVIAALAQRGTRAAIVLSAGLRQPGPDGVPLEQAMLAAARPALLRILGGGSIGLLVPRKRLNASFAPGSALPGAVAFVGQSGALATAMLDWANVHGIGFSHFISLGDGADVDFGDVLDYLASDGGTRAILMYMESARHARKFMSAARGAARNKPVIVVKAGRAPVAAASQAGAMAGAMAGPDAVFDAAVRRAGLLRVPTLKALFDAAATLAYPPRWRGERLAVLTNAGGAGLLAADALASAGGRLVSLDARTLQDLDAMLPAHWSGTNPVDIAGDAPPARYLQALRTLLAAPEVDGILFMHAPTAVADAGEIAQACLPLLQAGDKPVLACWLGGASVQRARRRFADARVPCYGTPEQAMAAWKQLADYHRHQQLLLELPDAEPARLDVDRETATAVLQAAQHGGGEWLDAAAALRVLQAYGIPVGLPVAAGGVAQALQPRPHARQLMAGVVDDAVFGPVLLFGEGGAAVNLHRDTTLELPPLNATLAHDMVARTRVGRTLGGLPGQPGVDQDALLDALLRLSQLACDQPALAELDLNPLLADEAGVLALAARIRVRPPGTPADRLALCPYPAALEETVALAGEPLLVRPIRPEDARRLAAFYARARPADLRLRFFLTRREVPLSELARYCQIDYEREMAFVALAGAAIAGEVRAVCDPDNERAEFAVQIASDWQRRGLGRWLLQKMIGYLRARGTRELTGLCLPDNAGMGALARALGFEQHAQDHDAVLLRLRLVDAEPLVTPPP
jgi:acetyltransferase